MDRYAPIPCPLRRAGGDRLAISVLVRGLATALCLCTLLQAQSPAKTAQDPDGLGELSLEELLDVEITSAAKKAQKLSDVMGAVHVITNEDIRRSGLRSIPEILRMVPGLQVARITGSVYAITARGFASQFSNKLLVLVDGRSTYSPLFSGVYWDTQDVLLEDVLRIEVIRGPGGALWGANAVNGVINIITKSTADTVGGVAFAGGGNEERRMAGMRYGFRVGDITTARIYAKYFDRDGQTNSVGTDQPDDWMQARVGFRVDRKENERSGITVQGDYYDGAAHNVSNLPSATPPLFLARRNLRSDVSGGNLLTRWRSASSDGHESMVQLYFDNVSRDDAYLQQSINTFDAEAQWRVPMRDSLEVMGGLGYRFIQDSLDGSRFVSFAPTQQNDQLFSGFLRVESELWEGVTLALGAKVEHNEYTGFETQPDARLRWRLAEHHTIWAAHSRAVRVPGRVENDVTTTIQSGPAPGMPGLPFQVDLIGNRAADPEVVRATELGYRVQVTESLSLDVTGFYNDYDNLLVPKLVGSPTFDPTVPRLVQNVVFANSANAETYGAEISGQWRPRENLAFSASYSYLRVQMHTSDVSVLPGWDDAEGTHPRNQAHVRMNLNLTERVELDSSLFYVDGVMGQRSIVRWDGRIGFAPTDHTDASLVFQNILDDRHSEFGTVFYQQPTETERSIYFKVTTRF
jgi:iron complex outermembrane recepter protein